MFSTLQCLILYLVVCGLLTLACRLLFKMIPWPGYLLTAVPAAAVICFSQGFMTAFIILSVINCIAMIPYTFATLVNIAKLFIPAVIETVFTVVQVSRMTAVPSWQKILFGVSLLCVFFAANADFTNCDVRDGLQHRY